MSYQIKDVSKSSETIKGAARDCAEMDVEGASQQVIENNEEFDPMPGDTEYLASVCGYDDLNEIPDQVLDLFYSTYRERTRELLERARS
jgi:hypothetical protein